MRNPYKCLMVRHVHSPERHLILQDLYEKAPVTMTVSDKILCNIIQRPSSNYPLIKSWYGSSNCFLQHIGRRRSRFQREAGSDEQGNGATAYQWYYFIKFGHRIVIYYNKDCGWLYLVISYLALPETKNENELSY